MDVTKLRMKARSGKLSVVEYQEFLNHMYMTMTSDEVRNFLAYLETPELFSGVDVRYAVMKNPAPIRNPNFLKYMVLLYKLLTSKTNPTFVTSTLAGFLKRNKHDVTVLKSDTSYNYVRLFKGSITFYIT